MTFEVEYRTGRKWRKTPTKNNDSYVGYEDNNFQDFRITTDSIEEFGAAIDKFLAEDRMVEWYWNRVGKYDQNISEFPVRTKKGRWQKTGVVTWKDNRAELQRIENEKNRKKLEKEKEKKSKEIKKLK